MREREDEVREVEKESENGGTVGRKGINTRKEEKKGKREVF